MYSISAASAVIDTLTATSANYVDLSVSSLALTNLNAPNTGPDASGSTVMNYINVLPSTANNQFLRFRNGNDPKSYAGTTFSDFDTNNYYTYALGGTYTVAYSDTKVETNDELGSLSTIMSLSSTGAFMVPSLTTGTGNISIATIGVAGITTANASTANISIATIGTAGITNANVSTANVASLFVATNDTSITDATVIDASYAGGFFPILQAGAPYNITLPNPTTVGGMEITLFLRTPGAADVTISPGSATLYGTLSKAAVGVAAVSGTTATFAGGVAAQGDCITFRSNGALWFIQGFSSVAAGITVA
jgi:hypothetical protein